MRPRSPRLFANGIGQRAIATGGGNASITLSNTADASISVLASAGATGATAFVAASTSNGFHGARVGTGMFQAAFASGAGTTPGGGDANAALTNDGSITIGANGVANATAGSAFALASVGVGVIQNASATNGAASVSLTNSGALSIAANASAVAGSRIVGVGATATTLRGNALAGASIVTGLGQLVNLDGGVDGSATLNNSGTIDITASAKASGGANAAFTTTSSFGTGTTAVTFTNPIPGAEAVIRVGLAQVVHAGIGTAVVGAGATATTATIAGDAIASQVNSGTINVAAKATATGTAEAVAVAAVSAGDVQIASAVGGNASASIDNSGTLNISAVANATGGTAQAAFSTATAAGTTTTPVPGALAFIGTGIHQVAAANPAVTGVTAIPTTGGGTFLAATAALNGNASVTLNNSGSISIGATANAVATGPAMASAVVGAGMRRARSREQPRSAPAQRRLSSAAMPRHP